MKIMIAAIKNRIRDAQGPISLISVSEEPLRVGMDSRMLLDIGNMTSSLDFLEFPENLGTEFWNGVTKLSKVRLDPIAGLYNGRPLMIQSLVDGESDLMGDLAAICCNRTEVIDFTNEIYKRQFVILFNQSGLVGDIILSQFSWRVWVCVAVALITILSVLKLDVWIRKRSSLMRSSDHDVDPFTWIFGFMSQQGTPIVPVSFSLRLTHMIGYVFGLLCIIGFTGNIVTTLTYSKHIDSVEGFIEHARKNDLKIFLPKFKPFVVAVESSKDPLVRELYELYLKSYDYFDDVFSKENLVDNLNEYLLGRLLTGDQTFAFIAPDNFVFMKFEDINGGLENMCQISVLPIESMITTMAFGMRRNLPDKQIINSAYIKLRETGIIHKLAKKYKPKHPDCKGLSFQSQFTAIRVEHIARIFILFAFGFLTSMAVLILEFCFSRFKQC